MGMMRIGRSVTVSTVTMGQGAAIFPLRLDRIGISIKYSAEPVCDVKDRTRWKLKPDVPTATGADIHATGIKELKRLPSR